MKPAFYAGMTFIKSLNWFPRILNHVSSSERQRHNRSLPSAFTSSERKTGWTDGSAAYRPQLSDSIAPPQGANKEKEEMWLERLGISEWPEGYQVLCGITKPGGNVRYDLYIFGHPHGRFRSHNEFAPHLAYLADPFLESCQCCICTRRGLKAEIRPSSSPICWLPGRGPGDLHARSKKGGARGLSSSSHVKMGKVCPWQWPSEYRPGEVVWACVHRGKKKTWRPAQIMESVNGEASKRASATPFLDDHLAKRQRCGDNSEPRPSSTPHSLSPARPRGIGDRSSRSPMNLDSGAANGREAQQVYRARLLPLASFNCNVHQTASKLYRMEEVMVPSGDIKPWTTWPLEPEGLESESEEAWHAAVIQAINLSSTWAAFPVGKVVVAPIPSEASGAQQVIRSAPTRARVVYPCFRFGTEEIRVNDLVELPILSVAKDQPFAVPEAVKNLQFSRDPSKNRLYLEVTEIWSTDEPPAERGAHLSGCPPPTATTLWVTGNLFRLAAVAKSEGREEGRTSVMARRRIPWLGLQPLLRKREGSPGDAQDGCDDAKERSGADPSDSDTTEGGGEPDMMTLQATVSVYEISSRAYSHLLGNPPARMPVTARDAAAEWIFPLGNENVPQVPPWAEPPPPPSVG